MEGYTQERHEEINDSMDDTPYQRWLASRKTIWKCKECDAITDESDLGVIWSKGNWGEESCCPICRSTNIEEYEEG